MSQPEFDKVDLLRFLGFVLIVIILSMLASMFALVEFILSAIGTWWLAEVLSAQLYPRS